MIEYQSSALLALTISSVSAHLYITAVGHKLKTFQAPQCSLGRKAGLPGEQGLCSFALAWPGTILNLVPGLPKCLLDKVPGLFVLVLKADLVNTLLGDTFQLKN